MQIPKIERQVVARPTDTFVNPVDTVTPHNERMRKVGSAFKQLGVSLDNRRDDQFAEDKAKYDHQVKLDGINAASYAKVAMEALSHESNEGKSPKELQALPEFQAYSQAVEAISDPKVRDYGRMSMKGMLQEVTKNHQINMKHKENVGKFSSGMGAVLEMGANSINPYIDDMKVVIGVDDAHDTAATYLAAHDHIEGMDAMLERDDLSPATRSYLMTKRDSALTARKQKETYEFARWKKDVMENGRVDLMPAVIEHGTAMGWMSASEVVSFEDKTREAREGIVITQQTVRALSEGASPAVLEAQGAPSKVVKDSQNRLAFQAMEALKEDPTNPEADHVLTNLITGSGGKLPKYLEETIKGSLYAIESIDVKDTEAVNQYAQAMNDAIRIAHYAGEDGIRNVLGESGYSQFASMRYYFNVYGPETALVKEQEWQRMNAGRELLPSEGYQSMAKSLLKDLTDDIKSPIVKAGAMGLMRPLIKQMDLRGLPKNAIEDEMRKYLEHAGFRDDANILFDDEENRGHVYSHVLRKRLDAIGGVYGKTTSELVMDIKEQLRDTLANRLGYENIEDVALEGDINNPEYIHVYDASGVVNLPYQMIHVDDLIGAFVKANRTLKEQVFNGKSGSDDQWIQEIGVTPTDIGESPMP